MFFLTALAAATAQPQPARVTVRIVRAQAVDRTAWEKSARRREVVRSESGRPVKIRLIEFE